MPPQPPVSAIVPAFNEANRIGLVLKTLTSSSAFHEIIVIDDGSSDNTSAIVSTYPVTLIRFTSNQGKSAALQAGIEASKSDIFFFCDADVIGLTTADITAILTPVIQGQHDMFIAMHPRVAFSWFPWLLHIVPLLSGERAVTRSLWNQVPAPYKRRFRIEAALNFYARYHGHGYDYRIFPHLSQTIKEIKYGLLPGFYARLKMSYEVSAAYTRLFWTHLISLAQ